MPYQRIVSIIIRKPVFINNTSINSPDSRIIRTYDINAIMPLFSLSPWIKRIFPRSIFRRNIRALRIIYRIQPVFIYHFILSQPVFCYLFPEIGFLLRFWKFLYLLKTHLINIIESVQHKASNARNFLLKSENVFLQFSVLAGPFSQFFNYYHVFRYFPLKIFF